MLEKSIFFSLHHTFEKIKFVNIGNLVFQNEKKSKTNSFI